MLDLKGRTVVITGASSGIGAAAAELAAKRGAVPVLAARRAAELEKVAEKIRASGGSAHATTCDVVSPEANEQLVEFALEKTGRLDVFVANAGVTMRQTFAKAKLETFRQIMDVNYFGTVYGFKAALPHVVERNGQLVIVSSFLGKRGAPTRTGYAASKHALHGLADALRAELLPTGVGVTVYCPGFVETGIRERAAEAAPSVSGPEKGMSPEESAEQLLRAIERRTRELVTPLSLRLLLQLDRTAPSVVDRLLYRRLMPKGEES